MSLRRAASAALSPHAQLQHPTASENRGSSVPFWKFWRCRRAKLSPAQAGQGINSYASYRPSPPFSKWAGAAVTRIRSRTRSYSHITPAHVQAWWTW